jgi:hypothetical protein
MSNTNWLVIGVMLVFLSCAKERSNNPDADIENKLREMSIKSIVNNFNIKFDWDTINYSYSYQYQNILESEYQLISDFLIKDIIKVDSFIEFHIICGNNSNIHLNLSIESSDRVQTLMDSIDANYFYRFFFVVNVNKLTKVDFHVYLMEADEDFGIEKPSLFVDDIMGGIFYGNGKIVEIKNY